MACAPCAVFISEGAPGYASVNIYITGDDRKETRMENQGTAGHGTTAMKSIVWAVLIVSLAGLLFGYDTGVASGIQKYLQNYFHLNSWGIGFAIACLDLGAIAGAMFAGPLSDRFGRKSILLACAVVFAVSGVLSAIPQTVWELVLARVLGGIAIGASSMVAPVYIAEIAPEKHRGRLCSLFQLGIVVGIALVYWVNFGIVQHGVAQQHHLALHIHHLAAAPKMAAFATHHLVVHSESWNQRIGWRLMLGSEVLPAILFFVLLLTIKESPRWLIVNNREPEARGILTRLFGAAQADREIAAVKTVASEEEGKFSELFKRDYRLPLIIALFLAIFSQFSGINSIIYYAPRVFAAAGMQTSNAFGATALIGMVNLLFTFIAIGFVDKAGRKLLLMIGTAIQVVALASVALVFKAATRHPAVMIGAHARFQAGLTTAQFHALALHHHTQIIMAPDFTHPQVVILLTSVLVFIAAFAMAMGPMPWIIISEIFPARIRGRAASVGILTLWAAIFVVALTFPILKKHAGLTTTYAIYSLCSLISFLFVVFILPETKGRTLEEIELSWRHKSS